VLFNPGYRRSTGGDGPFVFLEVKIDGGTLAVAAYQIATLKMTFEELATSLFFVFYLQVFFSDHEERRGVYFFSTTTVKRFSRSHDIFCFSGCVKDSTRHTFKLRRQRIY